MFNIVLALFGIARALFGTVRVPCGIVQELYNNTVVQVAQQN